MKPFFPPVFCLAVLGCGHLSAADEAKRYDLTARASQIDPRVQAHPEIDFLLEKDGKPTDTERAAVDTRVAPQGKLVIWLMGYNGQLFDRLASYGLHAIQVHYANGWFGKFGNAAPADDDKFLGKIRLEAATGEDVSSVVTIPKPDGMMERSFQFVKWLAKENPQGRWEYFLTRDGKGAALGSGDHFWRLARGDDGGAFRQAGEGGPRGHALRSARPTGDLAGAALGHAAEPLFRFQPCARRRLDGRPLLPLVGAIGLQQFGPIVNVDKTPAPYGNSRRLITDADVKGDDKRAHGSVTPGGSAVKDAAGKLLHENVWRYLYTHPVERVGQPVPADGDVWINQRKPRQ